MQFETFDNRAKTFFKDGYIDEFNLEPDAKHTALRQGLLDYYQTYQTLKGNFYGYIEKLPNQKVILSQSRGHGFLTNYFSSITFVQLFIEVYIKEILEKIDNRLVTGQLSSKDEKNFINYIVQDDFSKFQILTDDRTIQFSVSLSRLTNLIKSDAIMPSQFKVDSKYHFIEKNEDMLNNLSLFRNSIIHKGNKVMAKYSFELLFVNFIIPFITALLRLIPSQTYLERNLYCQINILDEICKLKLDVDYQNVSKFEKLQTKLKHLNHLKELGRASFQNKLFMGEGVTAEQLVSQEYSHNKRIREENVFLAKQYKNYNNCPCPCCGTRSLVVEATSTSYIDGKTRVETISCLVCSYYINKEIGEPKEFNLLNQQVFLVIENTQNKLTIWQRICNFFRSLICK